jgi:DNA segregation ATPase FtsK/SpoIIIE, S-DNA-T family
VTAKRGTASRRGASRSRSARASGRGRSRQTTSFWDTTFFADHAADLWAIGLATVGVLLALALYGHAAGSFGRAIDDGLGAVVGWVRYLIPPVGVAVAVAVIVGRRGADPLRASLSVALGLLSSCGLADLAGGSPGPSASLPAIRSAGGFVGAVVGHALERGTGTAGAVVIFLAAFIAAVVLATGLSLRTFFDGAAVALRFVGRAVQKLRPRPAPAALTVVSAPVRPVPFEDEDEDEDEEDDEEEIEDDEEPLREVSQKAVTRRRRSSEPALLPVAGEWRLPPLGILHRTRELRHDERQLDAAGEALIAALAAHGVMTRLVDRTVGPTVTRFELELGAGVKVARVTSLHRDIAYAMASPDVRILAPIPGKSAIGVEVPNAQRQLVVLGDLLSSDEARRARHPLEVALGRDIAGRPVMVNLAEMPHVLISGATGSGKSSCINSLITSVLFRATPDQVRLILVDPKRVELEHYNGLPHLLTPVVTDPKKAANALSWAVKEMERRYEVLAECGMRDITGYNEAFDRGDIGPLPGSAADIRRRANEAAKRARAQRTEDADDEEAAEVEDDDEAEDFSAPERLPYVLVVVDELNDLMMVAARDVEESVVRIAQMARAVGIHLVLATQRPSVDVITGVIKANVPSRMAFAVSSLADSRVILDQAGAERLIGRGDMLLLTASSNITRRLQGPWVSEEEVRETVAHWRRQGRVSEPVVAISELEERASARSGGGDDDDELLQAALELVVRSQLGSTSMLQRKLRVGFARAGRLMDLLERRGVVGPSEGSKARAVLMTPEELDDRSA